MASGISREAVSDILRDLIDPVSGQGLLEAGLIDGVRVEGGHVQVIVVSSPEEAARRQALCVEGEKRLTALKGVEKAQFILTAHRKAQRKTTSKNAPRQAPEAHPPQKKELDLPFSAPILLVASGKGGVGKSSVAVNLAVSLAKIGLRAGLLDADIYGPSVPQMLGVEKKPQTNEEKRIIPHEAHGVKIMSLGFLVDPSRAMVWRGPMVHSAITQMLRDVAWGDLDIMVVDMPPGTGDASLTMAQTRRAGGVVLVCTPQALAVSDLRRALHMFRRLEVPMMGIVENMAWYEEESGKRVNLFGEGGTERFAKEEGVEFLGALPLTMALREGGDMGKPASMMKGAEGLNALFDGIAQRIAKKMKLVKGG